MSEIRPRQTPHLSQQTVLTKCYKTTKSRFLKHFQNKIKWLCMDQCWERSAHITPGTTAQLRARGRLGFPGTLQEILCPAPSQGPGSCSDSLAWWKRDGRLMAGTAIISECKTGPTLWHLLQSVFHCSSSALGWAFPGNCYTSPMVNHLAFGLLPYTSVWHVL